MFNIGQFKIAVVAIAIAAATLTAPLSAETINANRVKTSDKHQKAVLDFVKGKQAGTVGPVVVRPAQTAGVKPLTSAQCKGLGGVVIAEDYSSCGGGMACSTTDQNGVVRRACIKENAR